MVRERMPLSCDSSPSRHDQGFAWIILISSFLIQMMIDGLLSAYGYIHPSMKDEFGNATTSKLILPGSLQAGFYQITASLSAVLVNRMGTHIVSTIGAVVSCVSVISSGFVGTLPQFSILFGACCGIGLSFMFIPAIVTVNLYFKKFRPLASGISMTGSGVGYIVIPILTKFLVANFDWRNTVKILGGLFGICIVCSLCLRPFVEVIVSQDDIASEQCGDAPCIDTIDDEKDKLKNLKFDDVNANLPLDPSNRNSFSSTPAIYFRNGIHHSPFKSENYLNQTLEVKTCNLEVVRPLSRRDIFYSGFLSDIPSDPSDEKPVSIVDENCEKAPTPVDDGCWGDTLKLFDFALYRDFDFVMLVIMAVLVQLSYFIPFMYLNDFATRARDLSAKDLTALTLGLGISHALGRVTGGLLANLKRIHPLHLSFASIALCGISSLCVPYCTDVYLLMIYAAVQGFALGVTCVMQPLLLVKYVGINRLTSACGNQTMLKGFASLCGAPVAALLLEKTGNYNSVFLWAGSCYLAALIPHFPFYSKICRQIHDDSSADTEIQSV